MFFFSYYPKDTNLCRIFQQTFKFSKFRKGFLIYTFPFPLTDRNTYVDSMYGELFSDFFFASSSLKVCEFFPTKCGTKLSIHWLLMNNQTKKKVQQLLNKFVVLILITFELNFYERLIATNKKKSFLCRGGPVLNLCHTKFTFHWWMYNCWQIGILEGYID